MKNSTNTLLTGLAAAAALTGGVFAGLNAWFVSGQVFAEHEAQEQEAYATLSVTLEQLVGGMMRAERERREDAIQKSQDGILLLKAMDAPQEHIDRTENRLLREIRALEKLE